MSYPSVTKAVSDEVEMSPKAIAGVFCEMKSDEQAEFFHEVAAGMKKSVACSSALASWIGFSVPLFTVKLEKSRIAMPACSESPMRSQSVSA